MKTYWEPGGCTLVDCPNCGVWLDADAERCNCGWSIEGADYEPEDDPSDYEEYDEEGWNDVSLP